METVTLDDYIDGPVDLLKIDVVGAELKVLNGALSLIEDHTPKIVLPYLPYNWEQDDLDVFAGLESIGYRPKTIDGKPLDFSDLLDREEGIPNILLEPVETSRIT
jgi:hypothetical protein